MEETAQTTQKKQAPKPKEVDPNLFTLSLTIDNDRALKVEALVSQNDESVLLITTLVLLALCLCLAHLHLKRAYYDEGVAEGHRLCVQKVANSIRTQGRCVINLRDGPLTLMPVRVPAPSPRRPQPQPKPPAKDKESDPNDARDPNTT